MKSKHLNLIFFLFTFASASWGSPGWVQGAFLLHEIKGEVDVSELGEAELENELLDLPVGVHGRFSSRADSGAEVFLSASNRMFVQFRGRGEFGVERFEQTEPEQSAWLSSEQEYGQSRLLLSFRSGHIFLDTRALNEASRVAVETPLGRITSSRALWQMRIAFDQRSGIFDFEIACSHGRLSFTDRRDLSYALRAGQRLSGAGGWKTPGIEIVEMTGNDQAAMEDFLNVRDKLETAANRLEPYLPLIGQLSAAAMEPENMRTGAPDPAAIRPVIIEYAPRPRSLTPFRGEIPTPAADQAD